ncbi:hypothetical protein [Curtobacterium flaccumfaciens]|uniref:hypothetical protein n=1 Tax=Curtobacterium flaccumfaciens TaxID=2035 RepID=UPI001BDF5994|nr:hypothetical protein [Curtobacterium flaccumfaciens]MBT1681815.1 hypothetical protein [Curtobacterium flaccumfaciens pv. flaccumfaciens]
MDRATAKEIIAAEGLERAVWFKHPTGKPNAVAIFEVSGGYRVASTDERAVEIGPRDYQDESDALEMFIMLLRDLKELIASGVVR